MKPTLQNLWNNFPDHNAYPTLKDLYTWLGGAAAKNIDAPGFGPNGNTCATRLSVAFNKAGAKINKATASSVGAQTVSAADGSQIIFRVGELRKYLVKFLGAPATDNVSPFDSDFRGIRGIIAFTVNWADASGHIALWNGTTYREPAHDNFAMYVDPRNPKVRTSRGEFWRLL
jgi:phosphotransferase system IIB component